MNGVSISSGLRICDFSSPYVNLPAHRVGLPGNEISFFIVPLDPAYKAGLAGHLPVTLPCPRYPKGLKGACSIENKREHSLFHLSLIPPISYPLYHFSRINHVPFSHSYPSQLIIRGILGRKHAWVNYHRIHQDWHMNC